jgi:hypothetical protein
MRWQRRGLYWLFLQALQPQVRRAVLGTGRASRGVEVRALGFAIDGRLRETGPRWLTSTRFADEHGGGPEITKIKTRGGPTLLAQALAQALALTLPPAAGPAGLVFGVPVWAISRHFWNVGSESSPDALPRHPRGHVLSTNGWPAAEAPPGHTPRKWCPLNIKLYRPTTRQSTDNSTCAPTDNAHHVGPNPANGLSSSERVRNLKWTRQSASVTGFAQRWLARHVTLGYSWSRRKYQTRHFHREL